MVLKWLKEIMGGKKPKHEKHSSLHTMGPEELLDASENPVMSQHDADPDYSPIEPAETHHRKNSHAEMSEDVEPVIEMPDDSGMNKSDAMHLIEAALFMSSKGMNVEELGRVANVPLLKVRAFLPDVIETFNRNNKTLEIVEDAGGFRMKVRAPYDEKVAHLGGSGELSPAELKTLAFIAYKQPLLQSQLVQVRSNTAYEHLQLLVDKGFVAREPKGRSYILRTTKKFSEYFGTHALKLKPIPKQETPIEQ